MMIMMSQMVSGFMAITHFNPSNCFAIHFNGYQKKDDIVLFIDMILNRSTELS